jgi:PAS domain S-box-containing protein
MTVLSGDGRRLYVNEVALDFLGWSLEDFFDERKIQQGFHPDDLAEFLESRQHGISRGIPFKIEARIRRKDGQYRWFLFLYNPCLSARGQIDRWYATGTDIEDRKQAETSLRRSEAYLAEAQRLSHTGSFGWDVAGGEIYWSSETFRIFEYEPTGMVTIEIVMQRTHPEDRPTVRQLIERVSREATPFDIEHRLLMPGGSVKYVHVVGRPSENKSDSLAFVGAVTDITERKRAEQILKQSEARLAEAQRLSHTGSWAWNKVSNRTYWSEETFRIYGFPPETTPTRELFLQRVLPDDLSVVEAAADALVAEDYAECDFRLVLPDHSLRYVRSVAQAVKDENGQVIEFFGTTMDVTQQHNAQEALRRSEGYLAEAQKLSHTGSWAWDCHRTEIIHWSPETFRVFGFDPKRGPVTWQEARSHIHPEDLKSFDEKKQRVATEKIELEFDFRLVHPDGATKYAHCVSRPVINDTGEVVELVGSIMDVTEQYESRAALEKAFEEIEKLKDELYKENLALKDEIDQVSMFEEIVGTSDVLRRVLVQVAKVAPTDATVLIAGETGTGKELIARAIHRRSQRSSKTFVSVNCAAIPAGLIGSELFGHEKGAFTGATQRRLGRFELADGGTLFLDEVGDLPPETQIALLRVLQERQLERVGGTQSIAVNVRIIAATNRDLKAAVAAGTFRSDLFYRLNVFPITVPSLRDRKDDIPLLVEYLTERYASKAGKKIKNIQKRTLELFQAYDWPGNIRELQNVIERAVILCDGETFSVDESWLEFESAQVNERGNGLARPGAEQERKLIESALAQSRGRIAGPSGAAAKLGIPRSTLETKIRKLGIVKHRFKSA